MLFRSCKACLSGVARAALDHLREENTELRADLARSYRADLTNTGAVQQEHAKAIDDLHAQLAAVTRERDEALAEAERLRGDSERLRHLDSGDQGEWAMTRRRWEELGPHLKRELEAAIQRSEDAAYAFTLLAEQARYLPELRAALEAAAMAHSDALSEFYQKAVAWR